MRNFILSIIYKRRGALLLLCSLMSVALMAAPGEKKPFVIPELKEWKASGGYMTLGSHTRIVYDAGQPELLRIAGLMADDCFRMFQWRPEIVADRAKAGDIALTLKPDKQLAKEGYSIKITDKVLLSAPQSEGIYWGTRTLLQITEQDDNYRLPKGQIRDYPDYPLRGFMIDCARKFIPLSYLQDLVKIMSYYKMNTLQIHLNDNGHKKFFDDDFTNAYSAFRLESDTYPGLTAYDGFYTKKEFIDLQKQAMALGIEIIPEIDVPAHSLAFSRYKPEIGSKKYGMDHLDLFSPETYPFIDTLFKEYLEGDEPVFCGKRVHVGTDEYSNETSELVEKFREFTDHYIRLVEQYGKQACVWGALTHAKGSTPVKADQVVMSLWNPGFANPQEMIAEGYQLVSMYDWDVYIVPGAFYYHDYLDEEKLYKEWTPAKIGRNERFEERHPSILGGMFALWNDLVGNGITVKDIHYRTFPALQTLAVKMWTGKNTTIPYSTFNETRAALSEAPGVNLLGRVGKPASLVYRKTDVPAGSKNQIQEIGYGYTVNFDLTGQKEASGTVLFRSPDAVFYLADPINGFLGFARDGYLDTFRYKIREGEKINVQIEGTSRTTTLKIDGKLIDQLEPKMRYFSCGKDSMLYFRTLVFPLEETGHFKSRVENLKVYNYCKE